MSFHEYHDDKRVFKTGLDIYEGGACNPRAIARAITGMIDYACEQGKGSDLRGNLLVAPIRLAVSQLSWLLEQGIGDYPQVNEDTEACKKGNES